MCTLEIDLEITTALPDKAYRPIQPSISKSPNIFASGGTATFRTARAFDWPSLLRYACWYLLNDLARTAHAAERYRSLRLPEAPGATLGATQQHSTSKTLTLRASHRIISFRPWHQQTSKHRGYTADAHRDAGRRTRSALPARCNRAPPDASARGFFICARRYAAHVSAPRGKTHIERRSRLQPFPSNEIVCPAAQGFRNRQTFETDASS